MKGITIAFFGVLLVGSCSFLSAPKNVSISLEIQDPDRFRFSGKGAGAGMMLSSSMGAMGVAIGVAIDEGIGKEIDETARAGGFNAQSFFQENLITHSDCQKVLTASGSVNDTVTVEIQRYGFVLWPGGEEERVVPQLHIATTLLNGNSFSIRYPEDYKKLESASIQTYSFEAVKNDAILIQKAMAAAVSRVCHK